MANQSKRPDPLEMLDQLDDFQSGRKFSDPTERITGQTVRRAAGKEKPNPRKTLYIGTAFQEWAIEEAEQLGIGVMAFYRLLLRLGKESLQEQGADSVERVVVTTRLAGDEEMLADEWD